MGLPLRYEQKVTVLDSGCWEWTGCKIWNGYGRIHQIIDGKRKMILAHRAVYEILVGPIPEGLTLDHLCRNRSCVNPAHLEAITMRDNVLRGVGPTAINARKTHCINGHLLPASRKCRECLRKGTPIGRPHTSHCPRGHLKVITSTGLWYCRECGVERERKRRANGASHT